MGVENYIYVLAILSAILISIILAKHSCLAARTILLFSIIAIPLATLSALFYGIIGNWDSFLATNVDFTNWQGHAGLYGALAGLLLAAIILCRIKRISLPIFLDILAPGAALAIAMARLGDYFSGSGFGTVVQSASLSFFPLAVYAPSLNCWLYAVFLYEALFTLGIFIFLISKKNTFIRPGDRFWWLLFLYSSGRIVFESMRADSTYIGFVKVSELTGLLIILGILILFSARAIKARGFKITDMLSYMMIGLSVTAAFFAEYNMGQESFLRNTAILALAIVILLLTCIKFYLGDTKRLHY